MPSKKLPQVLFDKGRLAKSVYPMNYKIVIDADMTNFVFEGIEEIMINCKNHEHKSFAVHSTKLNIKYILLDNNKVTFDTDIENELIIINTHAILGTSQHVLKIRYSGIINEDSKGFYKSTYAYNNKKKTMASTQFEATSARECFVCFDEPNFKATFNISIVAPNNKTVLSNTNIKNIEQFGSKKVTIFETTPKMSSYIVAFAIGDFEYVEQMSKNNVKVRVYASEGNINRLSFSLQVACDALDWFEKWFNFEYPLKKLDLISIFNFSAGAMENLGLITFRPELLCVSRDTTLEDKQQVVITICHELAHQWFGNIATMEFWGYLWLNESMATYFGWLVCDELFPEWNIWNKFMDTEYVSAFKLDGLENSHPIETYIENSKDINQIFDGISYSKGSCVIRFLINHIGNDVFKQGMRHYMKTFAWGNTTSNDLWSSFDVVMGNANNKSIKRIMDLWITQTGYPVVSLYKDGDVLKIKQERFLTSGPNTDETKWIIPVKIYSDENEYDVYLYDKPITLEHQNNIIINPNRSGFYRVKYDVSTFNFKSLSVQIQKQILGDNFALCASGYQGFCDTFKLISQLNLSTLKDYELWATIISNLLSTRDMFTKNKNVQVLLEKYINIYVTPFAKSLFNSIGMDDDRNESANNIDLRQLLINFLATMNDTDIIGNAKIRFNNDKYKYILQIVGKHASHQEHEKLINLFKTKSDESPELKDQLLEAIACTSNIILLDNTIENFLLQQVRSQDLWHMVLNLMLNEHASDKTWKYLKNNWHKILEQHEAGSSGLSNIIKVIPRGFFTENELNDYVNFFSNPPEGTRMIINQATESLKNRLRSINRILQDTDFMYYLGQL